MLIRLYGRNYGKNKSYQTDIKTWMTLREKATGRQVVNPNVDSRGRSATFRALSPMAMGPVECYKDKSSGRLVTCVNVETAWQYSKVFSHVADKKGRLKDVSDVFIQRDAAGRIIGPSQKWFEWRDKAYGNPKFQISHPEFEKHKKFVRRPFPKNSLVCFWYWNGRMLNREQARQQIYATIYKRFLAKTRGFKLLKDAYNRWQDIAVFDADGYDWIELGMTPADCIRDEHSFGHGHVIAFLLQGIDPTKLVKSKHRFQPVIQRVPASGRMPKLYLDWRKYDAYVGKQTGLLDIVGKAEMEKLARKILQIHPEDAKRQWGEVFSPGRYATVLHVLPGIRHGFGRKEICFKVFNQNPKDGLKWGPELIKFHAEQRSKMPGLPHPRVQEVITTGGQITPDGRTHHYMIQEWIAGNTLDILIKRGVRQADILHMLDDLFLKIVIPLWQNGVVWWDFRLNNMVFNGGHQLYLIDSDVLDACADEVLLTPAKFKVRNGHSQTIIGRYRTWLLQHMISRCLNLKGGEEKQLAAKLRNLFETKLHPAFWAPFPRDTATQWNGKAWAKRATAAYKSFRAELVDLFGEFPKSSQSKMEKSPSLRHG